MPSRPLEGVRVLDVTRVVSGPVCCFFLAALGAEVIRVEPPGGDVTWRTPPFVGPDGVHRGVRGPRDIGLSALRKGRGKRSIVIDLTHPEGRDLVRRLALSHDVLVENFKPGTAKELGLDPTSLLADHPGLIYCTITGYGHDGPYRDRAAMDLVVQAVSGLMAKTGFPDGPPTKVGATVGDQVPAAFAALGIVAALRQRDRDGRGQVVDVAMLDGLLTLLWDEPLDDYEDRGIPERIGNGDPRGGPLDTFRCTDGWIALVVMSDGQWGRLAKLIGRPDLAEQYPTVRDRSAHLEEVSAAVAGWCANRTKREASEAIQQIEVPVGLVAPPWAARHDPHVAHRGALERLRHPDLAEPSLYLAPVLPLRMSASDLSTAPAEPLGSSTVAVLRDTLGLDDATITRLHDDGVVASVEEPF